MISSMVSSSSVSASTSSSSTSYDPPAAGIPNTQLSGSIGLRDRPSSSNSASNEHVHHHHHHHHSPITPIPHFHSQMIHQPRPNDPPHFPDQPQVMLTPPRQPTTRVVEMPYVRHPHWFYGPEIPVAEPTMSVIHDAPPAPPNHLSNMHSPRYWGDDESDPPSPVVSEDHHRPYPMYINVHTTPYCPHYQPRTIVHVTQPTSGLPEERAPPMWGNPSSPFNYNREGPPIIRYERAVDRTSQTDTVGVRLYFVLL